MKRGGVVVVALVLLLASFGRAEAQRRVEPAGFFGVSLVAADAVGELGGLIDNGFGLQLEGGAPMTADGLLRIRGDLGFIIYGHERQFFCYTLSCRVGSDLTTTNSILYGGIGPELAFPMDGFEPYVRATAGLSYFLTTSSVDEHDGYGPYLNTTNYDDLVFAWKAGGGFRLRVGHGYRPVWLDFGVERHDNGVAHFLTKGDIVDHADGSISVFPNRSEANLVTFRFGVSIGFPRGGDRDRR